MIQTVPPIETPRTRPDDPAGMTPAQRGAELGRLLALGYLRLKARRAAKSSLVLVGAAPSGGGAGVECKGLANHIATLAGVRSVAC